MLDDRYNGWTKARQPRVLERFGFATTGDHQTHVRIRGHPICRCCFVQQVVDVLWPHIQINGDGFQRVKQAVHVFVKEGPFTVIKTHAFPHAVAQHET